MINLKKKITLGKFIEDPSQKLSDALFFFITPLLTDIELSNKKTRHIFSLCISRLFRRLYIFLLT